jgi:hypothetical protein
VDMLSPTGAAATPSPLAGLTSVGSPRRKGMEEAEAIATLARMSPPVEDSQSRSFEWTCEHDGPLGLLFSPDTTSRMFTVEDVRGGWAAVERSAAARRIQPGCVLVSVQGLTLSGMKYQEGLALIMGAGRPVCLRFEPPRAALVHITAEQPCSTCQAAPLFCVCQQLAAAGPPSAEVEAGLARAFRSARAGPFVIADPTDLESVLLLLGPAGRGTFMDSRPENILEYEPGDGRNGNPEPLLFREDRGQVTRRYSRAAGAGRGGGGAGGGGAAAPAKNGSSDTSGDVRTALPLDIWKPYGGTSVKRLRISPFCSGREILQRRGKIVRPGEDRPLLNFHLYEISSSSSSLQQQQQQPMKSSVVLYHAFPAKDAAASRQRKRKLPSSSSPPQLQPAAAAAGARARGGGGAGGAGAAGGGSGDGGAARTQAERESTAQSRQSEKKKTKKKKRDNMAKMKKRMSLAI